MTDLIETGGDIGEQVHWKQLTVAVPEMAYVSAWVEVWVDQAAAADELGPFDGPPRAEARITRVGNHVLGESIQGTKWRYFSTCPTSWQGFPDGNREVEVTLRTHYCVATVTAHVRFHSLVHDTTTEDQPRPVLGRTP